MNILILVFLLKFNERDFMITPWGDLKCAVYLEITRKAPKSLTTVLVIVP